VSAVRSIVLFIRTHLADPALRFHLYTSPPKTVLRGAKHSLLQAGLVPATVVYVGLEDPSAVGVCIPGCEGWGGVGVQEFLNGALHLVVVCSSVCLSVTVVPLTLSRSLP